MRSDFIFRARAKRALIARRTTVASIARGTTTASTAREGTTAAAKGPHARSSAITAASDLLAAGAELGDDGREPQLVDAAHAARADADRDPALFVLEPEPLVLEVHLEAP